MKIHITLYILILCCFSAKAQIVLNNGVKIKVDGGTLANPVFVVLTPPASNPIVTSGATDGIIMEDEYNRLQYNLGTATTSITVPYMTAALEQIPLTVVTNTAGVGAGNIRFSAKVATTRATGFDNALYMPSDVTTMGTMATKSIDRFWIIDANTYTTKPSVILNFKYLDAEWTANGGNTISETNLNPYDFNSNTNTWGISSGIINTVTNDVSVINVASNNFFRTWTLYDNINPLPIELSSFDGTCVNNDIVLNWCTATEKNNEYFTIEQSTDGVNFTSIGKVFGNGTTGTKHCYQFMATTVSDINYFKLSQTDFNGVKESFKIISITSCNQTNGNIVIANNGTASVGVIINSLADQSLELHVHNSLGQIIEVEKLQVKQGSNTLTINLNNVSIGVYYVSVFNSSEKLISKKVLITDLDK